MLLGILLTERNYEDLSYGNNQLVANCFVLSGKIEKFNIEVKSLYVQIDAEFEFLHIFTKDILLSTCNFVLI
jgi:hypothetical protein